MNKYTTIRYHIFKELSKYRQKQKERSSDRIKEIAIPILSGFIVQLFVRRYNDYIVLSDKRGFVLIIIFIIALFIISTVVLKFFSNLFDNRIKPYLFPFGNPKKRITNEELESAGARFNYEVTYLIESAYKMALELEKQDSVAAKLSFQNVVFCLETADHKMKKSFEVIGRAINNNKDKASEILGKSKILDSMLQVVLETYKIIIGLLTEYSNNNDNLLSEEISKINGLYSITDNLANALLLKKSLNN